MLLMICVCRRCACHHRYGKCILSFFWAAISSICSPMGNGCIFRTSDRDCCAVGGQQCCRVGWNSCSTGGTQNPAPIAMFSAAESITSCCCPIVACAGEVAVVGGVDQVVVSCRHIECHIEFRYGQEKLLPDSSMSRINVSMGVLPTSRTKNSCSMT